MNKKIVGSLALLSFVGAITGTSLAHASALHEMGATYNAYTSHDGPVSKEDAPQALPYWHWAGVALGVLAVATEFVGGSAVDSKAQVAGESGEALFDTPGR